MEPSFVRTACLRHQLRLLAIASADTDEIARSWSSRQRNPSINWLG